AAQADRSISFQTIETGVANAGSIILQPSGGNVGIGGSPTGTNTKLGVIFGVSGSAANLAESVSYAAIEMYPYRNSSTYGMFVGAMGLTSGYIQSANTDGSAAGAFSINPWGGNVGIGTNSPATPLEVAGAITLDGAAAGGTSTYFDWRNNGSTFAYSGSAASVVGGGAANDLSPGWCTGSNNLLFGTANVERMRITSAGVVWIKSGILEINSESTSTATAEIDKIEFKKAHGSGAHLGYYTLGEIRSYTNGGYSGGMKFYTGKNVGGGSYASTFAAIIDSNGNVGIGTDSPTSLLTVDGDALASNFETSGTGYLYLGGHVRLNNPGSGAFKLGQYNGSSWTDTLNITNAGAGTFSSSISAQGMVTVTQNDIGTGESVGLRIIRSGGAQIWNITSGITGVDNTTFNVRNSTSNTNVFSIDASSNAATCAGDVIAYSDKK
ncbi:uncharacterized protein METZ01_LOCUS264878, partial [marine metagenome]